MSNRPPDPKNARKILGITLQQIRLDKEPCLTAAGAADYQHIFVPGVLGVRWAVGHHQAFCFGEDDIVLKLRSHKRLDIFGSAP